MYATAWAQKDSLNTTQKKSLLQKAFQPFQNSKKDTAIAPIMTLNNSAVAFLPYEGKIIRHIYILRYNTFETSANDSGKTGSNLLTSLHKKTKEWEIRNDLFIKEGHVLNAYVLAENERYIRSLNYIQDARILVNYIPGNEDSIDVVVITKDLFSLYIEVNDLSSDKIKARIGDANVGGMGQKLQFTGLYHKKREPVFAYDVYYRKNNIRNTFINAAFQYSQIRSNLNGDKPDEQAVLFMLDRPLISQFSHMAGGLAVGFNQSANEYDLPDSLYYNYRYNTVDAWLGYNLGVKDFLEDNHRRDRKFVSLRYLNRHFSEVPYQVGKNFNQLYNSRTALLLSFTFFRQTFYKTNYIYGFGTTEDVPSGYNIAFTTGWYKQLNLSRPYIGLDANKYIVSSKGGFRQYFLRAGGFMDKHELQDAGLLIGSSIFSKIINYRSFKIRQYLRFSYTRQFNRTTFDPLRLNNTFGLRNFTSDSAGGKQRISFHSETFIFTKWKLLGFQFAPFFFMDCSLLTPEKYSFFKSDFYTGFGGGIRIRNQNLTFGTIELRLVYFPRKAEMSHPLKSLFNTDIQFKYNTNYVWPPDILQLNSDYTNNIY